MQAGSIRRGFFQRLLGICATKRPADEGCWTVQNGRIVVDLARAPELAPPNGAIRLEGKGLPDRVLVAHKEDGGYYAFRNRCTHGGRRLDPVPAVPQVQCCSVGKATFDCQGKRISGSGKGDLACYPAILESGKLAIAVEQPMIG